MSRRNGILIAGPSGVGKGTLIQKLMDEDAEAFGFSVSHTTRDPRPGEENGVHYHFVTHEAFKELLAEGGFVEHAEVHGNYYGTSKKSIETVQSAGKCCILDVDVQGAQQVHDAQIGFHKIFIHPPSMELLKERLVGRGTETPEKVEKRMNNAIKEIEFANENKGGVFDCHIVNDDLEKAFSELKGQTYICEVAAEEVGVAVDDVKVEEAKEAPKEEVKEVPKEEVKEATKEEAKAAPVEEEKPWWACIVM